MFVSFEWLNEASLHVFDEYCRERYEHVCLNIAMYISAFRRYINFEAVK